MREDLDRLTAALAEQRRLIEEQRRLKADVLEQVRLVRIIAAETRRLVRRIPAVVVVRVRAGLRPCSN